MELITMLLVAIAVLGLLMFLFRDPESIRRRRLIDKIPGLPNYPLVGSMLPYIFLKPEGRWEMCRREIMAVYPFLKFWIGFMPLIALVRPEHYQAVLNNTNMIEKSIFYKLLHTWLGTGLLTASGDKWYSHRKLITPTFHFKILENFIPIFTENSNVLVRRLADLVGDKAFVVDPFVSSCTLDIICESAMGTSVNAQNFGESKYVEAVNNMKKVVIERVIKPYLFPEFILNLTKWGKIQADSLKIINNFTRQVIKDRKAERQNNVKYDMTTDGEKYLGRKTRFAFLDMLLEAAEKGEQLTDKEIQEEVDTFMFEGHDTVTSAITSTIYFLGLHPEFQDKVYGELDKIFQGSSRTPNLNDFHEMKYLEMVIKESLRLFPSVPLISRKANQDFELGEYQIPAGTTVCFFIHLLQTNPEIYPNPYKFDPDNFLPERVTKRHPFAYVPFSAGPRNCIGQKFAMLEMKCILSTIIRHYEVKSAERLEDIIPMLELVFRSKNGIKIFLKNRQCKTSE